MPRRRNPENRGLPTRWRRVHGAFYYQVPRGQESRWDGRRQFRLGATEVEAYRVWATRIELHSDVRTIADLLDRYSVEVVPTKARSTHDDQRRTIKRLTAVFGELALEDVRPRDAYKYVDLRRKKAAALGKSAETAALREFQVLRHALSKAVEWGFLDRNPLMNTVRFEKAPPRNRYLEDWELAEIFSLPPHHKYGGVRMLLAYIKLKLLTGLRRKDLLLLQMNQIQEDGIHVLPAKTRNTSARRIVYEWSPQLRAVLAEALSARPCESDYVFCTRRGKPYIDEDGNANGFDSMWQRFVARILAETKVTERFHEHDLRAKAASDAESLEHASQLLAHSSTDTTQRVYRRKPVRVRVDEPAWWNHDPDSE